jgi:hypothetical protein
MGSFSSSQHLLTSRLSRRRVSAAIPATTISGGNAVVYRNFRFLSLALAITAVLGFSPSATAQQTLGAITGTVVDPSGSAIPGAEIKAVSDNTKLVRTAKSSASGSYQLNDLPIGTYTITFSAPNFSIEKVPNILIQADRTITLPGNLAVGAITDSVTVDLNPLLNAVDTTNSPPAPSPASPFSLPASTRNFPEAPAQTRASATHPSGPTASATPPTPSP